MRWDAPAKVGFAIRLEGAIRTIGPPFAKGASFSGGEAPKGHGDDMRRFRDAEYLKRNRGFESDFLQSSVCNSSMRQPPQAAGDTPDR